MLPRSGDAPSVCAAVIRLSNEIAHNSPSFEKPHAHKIIPMLFCVSPARPMRKIHTGTSQRKGKNSNKNGAVCFFFFFSLQFLLLLFFFRFQHRSFPPSRTSRSLMSFCCCCCSICCPKIIQPFQLRIIIIIAASRVLVLRLGKVVRVERKNGRAEKITVHCGGAQALIIAILIMLGQLAENGAALTVRRVRTQPRCLNNAAPSVPV